MRKLQKFINQPECIIEELVNGFTSAYSRYYRKHPEVNGIILKRRRRDKVALVIGGGSGHEPMFSGFVGDGLADAAACGNIFASPDPNTIYKTAKAVEQGRGVLFVYGCYAGDNLNFDMAEELLQAEGISTAHVRVQDDIVSAPLERYEDRRGIAGDVFVVKIAGAVCGSGADLEEAVRVTEKARNCTWSVGVASSSATLPGAEDPIFELEDGEIEYGMGLHGERGVRRTSWKKADELVREMYTQIKEEAGFRRGQEVCVLVNSLGSTSVTELSVIYNQLQKLLTLDGLCVHDADLNRYCTSQEMGGFSISILLLDDELRQYYDMPCYSPYYAKGSTAATTEDLTEDSIPVRTDKKVISGSDKTTVYGKKRSGGELRELDADNVRNMLLYVAQKIIDNKDLLTKVDNHTGDGDHGIGMALGMTKVQEALMELGPAENVYQEFETAGKAMLLSMGGASGVIFGSLFLEGAKGMSPQKILSAEDIADMEEKSLLAIQKRGKAEPGDKTMVDALYPAVQALKKYAGGPLLSAMRAAEEAAKEGMEDTRKYQAKYGRAKSLGERAVGYEDAGAVSVYLIFQGMREYIEGGC